MPSSLNPCDKLLKYKSKFFNFFRVVKQLPKLEQLFKSDIINKITGAKDKSSADSKSRQEPSR